MFWVVSYDIADDKRRRKVVKVMEGYGRRVQFSVFECELNQTKLNRMERALKKAIHPEEDSIRFYPLNKADIEGIRLLGTATLEPPKPSYFL
jgi:CRISPR-associated protein Cas2